MSKTGKIILWVVIIVIVIAGIWWWVASQSGSPAGAPSTPLNNTPTSTSATSPSSTPSSTSYPQGDSDQSINQDITNLNAQMNGLSSDNASVTQSMDDQPVQQAD